MISISAVADWVSIISFIPFAAGFLYFVLRTWQLERRLKALAATSSERPAALAIGIGSSNAQNVSTHLKDAGLDMELLTITREGMIEPTEFPGLLKELKQIKAKLNDSGISELNLYYLGPVTFATAVGAMLDNWVPVKVFSFKNGKYELDFVLNRETILAPEK